MKYFQGERGIALLDVGDLMRAERTRGGPKFAECDDECLFCRRPMNSSLAHFWVHMVDGGCALAPLAVQYPENSGEMGMWRIGNACARKIPSAYKRKDKGGEP